MPEMTDMVKWILTGTCQIDGAVREAGYAFERPGDWTPPMRALRRGHVSAADEFVNENLAIKADEMPSKPPEAPVLSETIFPVEPADETAPKSG